MRLLIATLLVLGVSLQVSADHHPHRPYTHRRPYGTAYYAQPRPYYPQPAIIVVDSNPYSSRVTLVRPVGQRMDQHYRGQRARVHVVRQHRRSRRSCR